MTSLAIAGMTSLQSINKWISVIDTNLTNTKRIGYKETKISLKSGEIDNIGFVNSSGSTTNIGIPSATLIVSNTSIAADVQGSLTSTGNITDFALAGQGYFVVEDNFGQRFATRDGQFHFSNDGYLVTAQGLKVLSAGQDWIHVPASEQYLVDTNGRSVSPPDALNTTFNSSKYGNKKLMVVKIPVSGKLTYSKYGFTTYEMGTYIPINLNNDFKTTMDGLNPDQIKTINHLGISKTNEANVRRLENGGVKFDTSSSGAIDVKTTQALVSSHTFGDFGNSFDFKIDTPNEFSSIGFTFGLSEKDLTTNTTGYRGYNAGLIRDNAGNNTLVITDDKGNILVQSSSVGSIDSAPAAAPLTVAIPPYPALSTQVNTPHYKITLINNKGVVSIQLDTFSVATITNAGNVIDSFKTNSSTLGNLTYALTGLTTSNTYQTVGSLNTGLNNSLNNSIGVTTLNGGYTGGITMTNLQIKEHDKSAYYNMDIVGTKRSNFNTIPGSENTVPGSNPPVLAVTPLVPGTGTPKYTGTEYNTVDPDSQETIDTAVKQQFVEESTVTVTDVIPQLSNTQKVFTAIAKIINVANSISDDMNALIR
ncbi:MAG: hypothetical protein H7263_01270 [Candidatus Sericytochromatia bacterium]|nr:hypothetical protein [Candidatus Sericytochromatia bacterium]